MCSYSCLSLCLYIYRLFVLLYKEALAFHTFTIIPSHHIAGTVGGGTHTSRERGGGGKPRSHSTGFSLSPSQGSPFLYFLYFFTFVYIFTLGRFSVRVFFYRKITNKSIHVISSFFFISLQQWGDNDRSCHFFSKIPPLIIPETSKISDVTRHRLGFKQKRKRKRKICVRYRRSLFTKNTVRSTMVFIYLNNPQRISVSV